MNIIEFCDYLNWLDGTPLLRHVEGYRRDILSRAFETDKKGRRKINMVLAGRAKKNWKSTDLAIAALYSLLTCTDDQGVIAS
jgi:hypothetical protein